MVDPSIALLVEDERQIRRFIHSALEREGWRRQICAVLGRVG
jgi:DNA-binding response OmpR family regulator